MLSHPTSTEEIMACSQRIRGFVKKVTINEILLTEFRFRFGQCCFRGHPFVGPDIIPSPAWLTSVDGIARASWVRGGGNVINTRLHPQSEAT